MSLGAVPSALPPSAGGQERSAPHVSGLSCAPGRPSSQDDGGDNDHPLAPSLPEISYDPQCQPPYRPGDWGSDWEGPDTRLQRQRLHRKDSLWLPLPSSVGFIWGGLRFIFGSIILRLPFSRQPGGDVATLAPPLCTCPMLAVPLSPGSEACFLFRGRPGPCSWAQIHPGPSPVVLWSAWGEGGVVRRRSTSRPGPVECVTWTHLAAWGVCLIQFIGLWSQHFSLAGL